MEDYQSLSHTRWQCKYHVIFIPKHRRRKLFGVVRKELGKIFRRLSPELIAPNTAEWFVHPGLNPAVYSDFLEANGDPYTSYVLDDQGDVLPETGVKFRCDCRTQVLGTYTQIQHPTDPTKWGYWAAEFEFSWRYVVSMSAAMGQGVPVESVYAGKVTINEDTGKITDTPPNIPVDVGYLPTQRGDFTAQYRVTVTGTGKSMSINVKIWAPRRKTNNADTPPGANEAPLVNSTFTDEFTTGTLTYPKPK